MRTVQWLNQRPENVADRAEPSDVLAEIAEGGALDAGAQRVLDYVLAQWTLSAIARTGDIEGVVELHELVSLAIRELPPESVSFRSRWEAFRDLLESKRLSIGASVSARARNLLHAQPILELLERGEMVQSELREKLGLSAARLSQVLTVMEEGRLITRRKQGKENMVALEGAGLSRPRTTGQLVWGRTPTT